MNKKLTYSLILLTVCFAIYLTYCFFMKKEGFYFPYNSEDEYEILEEYGKPLESPIIDVGDGESNDKISSRQFEKTFPYDEEAVIPSV